MAKINLLSSKIYNRISAGEVVERPASVVKELVENSLDAGASNIIIEIENGGISSIKVTDNGYGIEKSEIKKALLPHATSKISTVSDLDNICSFGFRGEALASIAAVSKITIVSKTDNSDLGSKIYSEGGVMSEVVDCGASVGTEITVNNLFYNTPVREKFLKSERSEENEISSIVSKFILGNTSIAFKYVADGKVVYQSYGDGFESALVCVYGPNIVNDCFYIDTEKNGVKINGYIGKQYFSKGNRSYQTVFLNKRYINNQTVSLAVNNAYLSYMMKRQYPFYVLSLTVPTEFVDVNVHPNKLDVRFANNQIVYGSVYSVISKVLDGAGEALKIVTENSNRPEQPEIKMPKSLPFVNKFDDEGKIPDFFEKIKNDPNYTKPFPKYKKPPKIDLGMIYFDNNAVDDIKNFNPSEKEEKATVDVFLENKAFLECLEKERLEKTNNEQQVVKIDQQLNYIGQALNTFLIFDNGEDLFFVDQHAAHERILFDKLNESLKKAEIIKQPLLIPYVLNVNFEEFNFLFSKLNALNDIGIEISEFGKNAFKVSAIPAFMTELNIQKFFDDILSDLNSLKTITVNDVLTEKLAQKACKSAIKSGDKLSESEIVILTEKLKENMGLKCPHGRPVVIKISRTEIDKWFKRII